MPWMPLSDSDPLKKVSEDWVANLPDHVFDALVSLAQTRNLSVVSLVSKLAIEHQLALAWAALPTAEDIRLLASLFGFGSPKK